MEFCGSGSHKDHGSHKDDGRHKDHGSHKDHGGRRYHWCHGPMEVGVDMGVFLSARSFV